MKKRILLVLCLMLVFPLIVNAETLPANNIRIYKDGGYSGSSSNMSTDNPDLVAVGWNDAISSIKLGSGVALVIVYENTNYGGKSRTITSNTDFSGNWWNDKISSFRIIVKPPAYNIRIYKDGGYSGSSSNMSADNANLVSVGWNDMITCIVLGDNCKVQVFENIDYGGQSKPITGPTDFSGDWWNDKISSFKIIPK